MFCSFPSKCTHVVCDGGGGGRVLLQGPRYAEADGAEGGALQGLHRRVEAGVAEVDVVDLKGTSLDRRRYHETYGLSPISSQSQHSLHICLASVLDKLE